VRKSLGKALASGAISYKSYCDELQKLIPEWGYGRVLEWFEQLELAPAEIAYSNIALCAVANDQYTDELFEQCFARHTSRVVASLRPDLVLLCGKKRLRGFVERIEGLGTRVVLTWHIGQCSRSPARRSSHACGGSSMGGPGGRPTLRVWAAYPVLAAPHK
jgi:hypothetical protein